MEEELGACGIATTFAHRWWSAARGLMRAAPSILATVGNRATTQILVRMTSVSSPHFRATSHDRHHRKATVRMSRSMALSVSSTVPRPSVSVRMVYVSRWKGELLFAQEQCLAGIGQVTSSVLGQPIMSIRVPVRPDFEVPPAHPSGSRTRPRSRVGREEQNLALPLRIGTTCKHEAVADATS